MRTPLELLKVSSLGVPKLATVTPDNKIVPWLAAEGEYCYSPERPPSDDSYYDYSRAMPELFRDKRPARFGQNPMICPFPTDEIEIFWKCARTEKIKNLLTLKGARTQEGFSAPIAVYQERGRRVFYLVQNGSFQRVDAASHPEIHNGNIRIYRGVKHQHTYIHNIIPNDPEQAQALREINELRQDFLTYNFVTSLRAFSRAHANIHREETSHIITPLEDRLLFGAFKLCAEKWGYTRWIRKNASDLDTRIRKQHFSTWEHIAQRKFGPNYICLETTLSNIQISSFFSGENEVTLLDPNNVVLIAAHGCRFVYEDITKRLPMFEVG